MESDLVAGVRDLPSEPRVAGDLLADEEERRPCPAAVELRQDGRRPLRVGRRRR